MNPYEAAKKRYRELRNPGYGQEKISESAGQRPSLKTLEGRVQFVRSLPQEKVEELIKSKKLNELFGLETCKPETRWRAVRATLIAAGRKNFTEKGTEKSLSSILAKIPLDSRLMHEVPVISALEMAGIIRVKRGSFTKNIEILDKERLQKSIKEKKIDWGD